MTRCISLGARRASLYPKEVTFPKLKGDRHCEVHFRSTHSRDSTGRYMVRLPFKTRASLGSSKPSATGMLENCSANSAKILLFTSSTPNSSRSTSSSASCSGDDTDATNCYSLPHHGVLRESTTTTKLRVVFNGSQKTREGLSLSDVRHSGRKIQQDLDAFLLRWRVFRYVFSSDIQKMHRQILVHPEHQRYQRILRNENPSQAPSSFELITVT